MTQRVICLLTSAVWCKSLPLSHTFLWRQFWKVQLHPPLPVHHMLMSHLVLMQISALSHSPPASIAEVQQKHPDYTSNTCSPELLQVLHSTVTMPESIGKRPHQAALWILQIQQCGFMSLDTQPPEMHCTIAAGATFLQEEYVWAQAVSISLPRNPRCSMFKHSLLFETPYHPALNSS